ncbi:MAG TPA: AMP-binding protein [Chryseosolibacter sp.]|nr:AMP-binding protein [Chryseosolibacter sp.]
MSNGYPYESISINHREVTIASILNGTAKAKTDFERSTFEFMHAWLSGQEMFTIQTSGSTGTPKRISIHRSQMITSAKLTGEALNLRTGTSAVVALDTKYIAGMMMLVRSLELGLKIIAVEPASNPFNNFPEGMTIGFTALVPYQVQHVLESKHPQILNAISTCIIGGAPLNENIEGRVRSFALNAFITYGMTETISHIALKRISPFREQSFTCLPEISVSADERSCLVIQAPYLHEPVITNDVVSIFNNHQFEWRGRYDNVINSAGVKISPELLENEIGQLFTRRSLKQPFFFFGIPDGSLGERLVMIFESPAPAADVIREVKETLLRAFSAYHVPKEFYEAAAFIYTPTRKVNRQKTFEAAHRIF